MDLEPAEIPALERGEDKVEAWEDMQNLDVPGFKYLKISTDGENAFKFYGSVKMGKDDIYHLNGDIKKNHEGRFVVVYPRWQTFTGKPVRGKNGVKLEGLTSVASEHLKEWANRDILDVRSGPGEGVKVPCIQFSGKDVVRIIRAAPSHPAPFGIAWMMT